MLRFLLSIEQEALGDNVADMIAFSTGENLLRTPSSNATPACSETLKRFRIYPLSYEALQRFIEVLSNLTRPRVSFFCQPAGILYTAQVCDGGESVLRPTAAAIGILSHLARLSRDVRTVNDKTRNSTDRAPEEIRQLNNTWIRSVNILLVYFKF